MTDYNVLSPNLNRRPDRWTLFVDTLVSQGTPADHIKRFPSHDGRDYPNMEDAREHAVSLAAEKGQPSRYLSSIYGVDKFNYCWCWTWHDCIELIAAYTDDCPRLLIIDDCRPRFDYTQICQHLSVLEAQDAPFMMAQYGGPGVDSPSRVNNSPIPNLPIFQYGLAGNWDVAVIYSPRGARWLLDFMQNREYKDLRPGTYRPNAVGGLIARLPLAEQRGMYGATLELPLAWPKNSGWTAILPTGDDDTAIQDRCEYERPQKELRGLG